MKNIYIFLFFVLFSTFLKPIESFGQIDTRFWFAAPEVTRGHGDRDIFMRFAAFDQAATVVISMPATPSFTPIVLNIAAFGSISTNLTAFINLIETPNMTNTAAADNDANRNYSTIFRSGILVESTAKITAYYEVNFTNNPDIFALKGKNGLGTDFYVPLQTAWNHQPSRVPNGHTGFVIVATEDNTIVTVTTTKPTRSFGLGTSGTTAPAGTYTLNLSRGQTYTVAAQQPTAGNAPAGSRVTSNKPVAVTLYHDSINSGANGCYDVAGDQLVPVPIVGNEYVVMRGTLGVGATAQPEKVYVLGTQNGTIVNVNRNGTALAPITLAAGEQKVFDMDLADVKAYIKSNHPIYVLHMSGYGCETGAAILPPIECTGSRLVQFTRSTNENFSLTLLVKEGGQGDFKLNNVAIPVGNFSPVPGAPDLDLNGTPDWYSARIDYNTTLVPLTSNKIENTSTLFHAGITNGGLSSGCRYGYFSSFNSLNLGPDIAIFYGSNVVLDATTYGAVSYTWNTVPVQNTAQITVNVRRTKDYIVAVDLGRCIVYDTVCVGTVEYVWIGDKDDDYGRFDNWSAPCGEDAIPNCERDIVIPAFVNGVAPLSFPQIRPGTIHGCRNIIIENGASLTISSTGHLNVCGDMVHSGSLVMPTGAKLEFQGIQPQTYTKNATGTGEFADLRINNLTPLPDVARVKVSDAGTQNMVVSPTGTLTFINGILRTEALKEVVVRNPSPSAISGYDLSNSSTTRFVGGRLRRSINTSGSYDLPVGLATENIGTATAVAAKRATIRNTTAANWVTDATFCALNPFPSNHVIALTDNQSNVADALLYRYIDLPASVAILGNAPRTIEAWVKISANPSNGAIFFLGTDIAKQLFALRKIGVGTGYRIDLGGGVTKDFNLSTTVGTWQHFAMTYNGISEVKVYLNGNEVSSLNVSDLNTTGNFYIGRYRDNAVPIRNWYLAGSYDNVRVWDVARAQGEIFANFCVRYECTIPPELIANYDMEDGAGIADHKLRNCTIDPLQYQRANVTFQTPITDADNLLAFFNQYPSLPLSSPSTYACQANFGSCEVLNHGFWTISAFNNATQIAGNGKYRLTLYNNAYGNAGTCVSPKAAIMKRATSANPWAIPPFPALCFNSSLGATSMEWMTGFSDFGVPMTLDPILLPVDLISLTAKPLTNSILVEWKTVNEIGNAGFEVMRSTDGTTATKVGWVTQNNRGTYSFEDVEVNTNQTYYYYLNQVDNNGDKRSSPVVDAKIDASMAGGINVYPNPTGDNFTIDLGETYTANTNYHVEIYNSIGMLLRNKTVSNTSKINMSLEGLAKGMYLVKVITPTRTKFVKLQKE